MPEISVIAPVYGVEQYIYQFVDSVLNQSYSDFELILVDDGSKDNCPAILDEYAAKDKRVKVIHQANGGVSRARNTGIEASTGNYIYIVDSDDWLEKDALYNLHEEAGRTNADLIMGDDYIHYFSGAIVRRHCFAKPFTTTSEKILIQLQQYILCQRFSPYPVDNPGGWGAPWSRFVKREIIWENNIRFDPYVRGIFDDGLYSLELAEHIRSFSYIQKPIYHYRLNSSSITQKYKADEIEILKLGFEKVEELIHHYHKEELLTLPYYCHVVRFLIYRLTQHFFNVNSNKTYQQTRKELIETIKSEPFRTAIVHSKLKCFSRSHRYLLICLRLHSVRGIKYYIRYKTRKKKGS